MSWDAPDSVAKIADEEDIKFQALLRIRQEPERCGERALRLGEGQVPAVLAGLDLLVPVFVGVPVSHPVRRPVAQAEIVNGEI